MSTSNANQILVVGATGFLGMEICRQLKAKGKNVTGFVRKTAAAEKINALKQWGVNLVYGDLKDRASIKNALKGIDTVVSTASSTFSRQDGDSIQTVDNEGQSALAEEAIAASVKQYIFISFPFGPTEVPLQAAKRRAEEKIKRSSMTYTILKPSFFVEAWLSPAVGFDFPNAKATIYGEGKNKISWISIPDVAAFAVASVDNPAAKNTTIEIGGPAALSPQEVVNIFEKTGGQKFELQYVPVAALQAQFDAAQDDMSKSFGILMLFYASGHDVNMTDVLKSFPMKMRTVQEYAQQVSAVPVGS